MCSQHFVAAIAQTPLSIAGDCDGDCVAQSLAHRPRPAVFGAFCLVGSPYHMGVRG